jgi:hypothetical protein
MSHSSPSALGHVVSNSGRGYRWIGMKGARCCLPDQGGIITGQADNAVPTGRLTQVFLITKWRWAVAKGFF